MPAVRLTLPQAARWALALGPQTTDAVIRGLQAGGLRLKVEVVREIESQRLVDTGDLKNSVTVTRVTDGALVTVDSPYAAPLEYGARPFTPPLAPLAEWALRKGLANDEAAAMRIARGIQKKFQTEGIPPRSFFRNALRNAEPGIRADINKECSRLGWRVTLSARRVLRSLALE